jgi:hypothetical protein
MDLFLRTSPTHLDDVVVLWEDGLAARALLDAAVPAQRFERPPSLRRACVVGGFRAGGPGTLAVLLVALLVASRAAGRDAVVFSVAAGIAVVAHPTLPAVEPRVLGLAVAMAAAYQGADLALQPERRSRRVEATLFGVLVGLAARGLLPDLVEGGAGRAHALLFTAGALVPGLLLAALARALLPAARWVGVALALLGVAVFAARAFGQLAPGL